VRVLVAGDWFLKVMAGQARGLSRRGPEVMLLCRDHAEEFGGDQGERRRLLDLARSEGVEVEELPGKRFGPGMAGASRRARAVVERFGPEVVSAHENGDPRLLAAVRGRPILLTVHDPVPHPGHPRPPWPERATAALWLRSASAVAVHGRALADELRPKVPATPLYVVKHGIDVRDAPFPLPSRPTILMFGRMEAYKGVDVLLEAMRHVWAQRPDVRLLLAGRGPAVAVVPRDDRIDLRDRYIPERDLDPLFAEATVGVLPYTQASQSGAGLWMMAAGLPVVVSDVGALSEIVEDPEMIARPGDPRHLADRLLAALSHGLGDRERLLERVRGRFSWDAVADDYVALYRSVIGG
jgi:glycosyltransferase involved in cell wall biosynthesis